MQFQLGFPLMSRDIFSDLMGDDGFGARPSLGIMPLMPGTGMTMMSSSMNSGFGSGSMVVMSSSYSNINGQVQSSTTTARMGPGGIAEVQSLHRDGQAGTEKILLERRMGEQARRVEKFRDHRTGDEETVDNTFGIQDGNEEDFDREWERQARHRLKGSCFASAGPLRLQSDEYGDGTSAWAGTGHRSTDRGRWYGAPHNSNPTAAHDDAAAASQAAAAHAAALSRARGAAEAATAAHATAHAAALLRARSAADAAARGWSLAGGFPQAGEASRGPAYAASGGWHPQYGMNGGFATAAGYSGGDQAAWPPPAASWAVPPPPPPARGYRWPDYQ